MKILQNGNRKSKILNGKNGLFIVWNLNPNAERACDMLESKTFKNIKSANNYVNKFLYF